MRLPEGKIKLVVNILKYYYLAYFIFALLISLSLLITLESSLLQKSIITIILLPTIPFLYYYGLRKQKPWLIPFVIILSGLGLFLLISRMFGFDLFINFQEFGRHSENIPLLRFSYIWGIAIAVFQIVFFTRKEVRHYFQNH